MPVIAGKYFVQYTFGALAIGSAIPIIDAIGVGLSSTISETNLSFWSSLLMDGRRNSRPRRWLFDTLHG